MWVKIAINSAVELGVGRCGQIRTLWAPVSKRERERERKMREATEEK